MKNYFFDSLLFISSKIIEAYLIYLDKKIDDTTKYLEENGQANITED